MPNMCHEKHEKHVDARKTDGRRHWARSARTLRSGSPSIKPDQEIYSICFSENRRVVQMIYDEIMNCDTGSDLVRKRLSKPFFKTVVLETLQPCCSLGRSHSTQVVTTLLDQNRTHCNLFEIKKNHFLQNTLGVVPFDWLISLIVVQPLEKRSIGKQRRNKMVADSTGQMDALCVYLWIGV